MLLTDWSILNWQQEGFHLGARVRMSDEQRREAILIAARQVAIQQGLYRVSIRAVAAQAGISHGLIIHHFGSADALLTALLKWVISRTLTSAIPATETAHPSTLLDLVEQRLVWFDERQDDVRLLISFWATMQSTPSHRDLIVAGIEDMQSTWHPIASDVVAQQPDRFAHTSPEQLVRVISNFVFGHVISEVIHPSGDNATASRMVLADLLRLD